IVNRAAARVPGASHFDVFRLPSRKTAVAYRPRTLIETIFPEQGSPACHCATCFGVVSRYPYGPWIISAGSAKRRASAWLSPAFRFALQGRTTAFIRDACEGCARGAWWGFDAEPHPVRTTTVATMSPRCTA